MDEMLSAEELQRSGALRSESLHETTVTYYDRRLALRDMPHRVPRGPVPDFPEEHRRMVRESQEAMRDRSVLEIASGTGTATREIAETAANVLGIEIAPSMLKAARAGEIPENVAYRAGDAFDLAGVRGRFDGGFVSGFFHVCPSSRYDELLGGFHDRLEGGATVFMRSSRPTSPDARSRLFRVEGEHDQFMTRQLSDGSEYVMVENDPTEDELRRVFEPLSKDLKVHIGNYWWWIRYELP